MKGKGRYFLQTYFYMNIINGHVKMGIYLGSYEVTCDHLDVPPIDWDCNSIVLSVFAVQCMQSHGGCIGTLIEPIIQMTDHTHESDI